MSEWRQLVRITSISTLARPKPHRLFFPPPVLDSGSLSLLVFVSLPHSMLADQADLPILAGDEDVTDALLSGPRALAVYQWLISAKPASAL